jgi:arginine exporter protein ArgO
VNRRQDGWEKGETKGIGAVRGSFIWFVSFTHRTNKMNKINQRNEMTTVTNGQELMARKDTG